MKSKGGPLPDMPLSYGHDDRELIISGVVIPERFGIAILKGDKITINHPMGKERIYRVIQIDLDGKIHIEPIEEE